MAKKETYFIRMNKNEGNKIEECYMPVSGYHYTLFSPVGSYDIGLTNKDVYGDNIGHWIATWLPYGVKITNARTKDELIETIKGEKILSVLEKAKPEIEEIFAEKWKVLLEEAERKCE